MNFWRKIPLYLRLAGLALVLGFVLLEADAIFNQPDKSMGYLTKGDARFAHETILNGNILFPVHDWTFSGPGGYYGLVGNGQNPFAAYHTTIQVGSLSYYIGFSIYTVIGAGNCFLFGGVIVLAGLVGRKRNETA